MQTVGSSEYQKDVLNKAQRFSNWNSRKLYRHISKTYQRQWTLKRGEVYFVDLGDNVGSEENKIRPCVVLQSNAYNFKSPVFTCAIISNSSISIDDIQVPIVGTYFYLDENKNRKQLTGTIDLGQIKTVAKERIISKVGMLTEEINAIDTKIFNALGLTQILIKKDNTINSLKGKVLYLQNKAK